MTRQLHLVRHAESHSNAGLPTEEPGTYPITDAGRLQAERFALAWGERPPQLVVTSPYVRTQLTAAPFRERFPQVPHETWQVQEWTFLCPKLYRGTTFDGRRPHVREFWERNEPTYIDGEGSESFVQLFERVRRMLAQVSARPEESIVAFTHGHFMRAVLWSMLQEPLPSTPAAMRRFRAFTEAVEVPNLARIVLRDIGGWHLQTFLK
jgi:probable phosphoglycerate mutase